jgi:tetratricopeptide (TPR) repeat protein
MTASATMIRADPVPTRRVELTLAHAHLRLGVLSLARVELETMAGLGFLDTGGFVDLAEVRWRTGDLTGAGEAAHAALRGDSDEPTALVIAAEAAAALGRPSEARRLAQRAMACAPGSIDATFAGMPRSSAWPPDADEPPPTAPTLFEGPEPAAAAETGEKAQGGHSTGTGATGSGATGPGATTAVPSGPVMRGFWDDEEATDDGTSELPDPALELEAGRTALVAGSLDQAALRLGLALRLAPALAPAVLEATAGARGSAIAVVRGDAYRLAGHEDEARQAYAVAAHGGAPERRKKSRTKGSKTKAKAAAAATATDPDDPAGDPAPDLATAPAGPADDRATTSVDEAPKGPAAEAATDPPADPTAPDGTET